MREAVEIFLDKDTSSSLPSTHEQQNGFLFFPLFPFVFLHLLSFCSILFFYLLFFYFFIFLAQWVKVTLPCTSSLRRMSDPQSFSLLSSIHAGHTG